MSTHSRQHPLPRTAEVDVMEVVAHLMDEFGGRLEIDVVEDVVCDSYEQLRRHVPRTAQSYLVPWARQRLLSKVTSRREPTLTEMLAVPFQRL